MLLEVDSLGPEWIPVEFSCSLEDPEFTEVMLLSGPVEIRAEVRRQDGRVQVRGNFIAAGTIECSRCLEATPIALAFPFDVVYECEAAAGEAHEVELTDEKLGVAELTGDVLDLVDFAREQVLLNVPTRVLCREDCRGLCELCGANTNLTPCGCASHAIDPRWQALQGLVDRES